MEGITFASRPGYVFLPVRELGEALHLYVDWDSAKQRVLIGSMLVDGKDAAQLFDDTNLASIQMLKKHGYRVSRDKETQVLAISKGETLCRVTIPAGYVEISLQHQELRAWQGSRLIMETPVSSGAPGHATPLGSFTAGPIKQKDKASSIYEDAPMPWSVQVKGDYFIHGSSSVPSYPASHGCIRMPLTGRNAAEYFFGWVQIGTEIKITDEWSKRATNLRLNESK